MEGGLHFTDNPRVPLPPLLTPYITNNYVPAVLRVRASSNQQVAMKKSHTPPGGIIHIVLSTCAFGYQALHIPRTERISVLQAGTRFRPITHPSANVHIDFSSWIPNNCTHTRPSIIQWFQDTAIFDLFRWLSRVSGTGVTCPSGTPDNRLLRIIIFCEKQRFLKHLQSPVYM